MKKSFILVAALSLAALALGAVLVMNSSLVARASDDGDDHNDHADHDHGHGHAGHQHGPNGECPLDAATAVGLDDVKAPISTSQPQATQPATAVKPAPGQ